MELCDHRAMRVDAQSIAAAEPELVEHCFYLLQLKRASRCHLAPETACGSASMMLIEAARLIEQRCRHSHRLVRSKQGRIVRYIPRSNLQPVERVLATPRNLAN